MSFRQNAWVLGVVGSAMVLAFIAHRLATGVFEATWSGLGVTGAVLLVVYLWLDREELEEVANSRGVRYSSMAMLLVLAALGVAVGANVLGKRYDKRWDATLTKAHTLSDQSSQLAAGLTREVEILAFFASGSPDAQDIRDLVEGYQEHTDKITFRAVDPIKEPLLAEQFAITSSYGTVVLSAGEDQKRLESEFGEEALTNALMTLTAGREHTLCFTTGHAERDPDDEMTPDGLGALVLKLEGQNYTVRNIVPLRDGIPSDCEVVVIADPQQDLLPSEMELITRHVAGGGALIAMLEPMRADGFAASLSRLGVSVGADIVLEENPNFQIMGGDISWIILTKDSFDFHPILDEFDGMVLMRVARSVSAGAPVEGIRVQELARTTEQGWADTDLLTGGAPAPTPGVDKVGRVPLLAVVEIADPSKIQVDFKPISSAPPLKLPEVSPEKEGEEAPPVEGAAPVEEAPAEPPADESWRKPGGKVLVFGDSDFAANELMLQGNNQDLILNAVAWMVGEEEQISIRPNETRDNTVSLTLSEGILVWGLSLFGVPGAALALGFGAWMKRRRL